MNASLEDIVRQLKTMCDLDLSLFSPVFVAQCLEKRRAMLGYGSMAEYGAFLTGNCDEARAFHQSMNINYSLFFRNPLTYAMLEQQIIPQVIQRVETEGPSQIRVWSAGCAAGQEPYTIAMIFDRLMAEHPGITFHVFATDINPDALKTAWEGVYPASSLGNVPLHYYRQYFIAHADSSQVHPGLKQWIDFSVHDLLDFKTGSPPASIYGDFDLIFCCNLLYYYNRSVQNQLIAKLARSLSLQGVLVTGEVEQDIVEKSGIFRSLSSQIPVFGLR